MRTIWSADAILCAAPVPVVPSSARTVAGRVAVSGLSIPTVLSNVDSARAASPACTATVDPVGLADVTSW